MSVIASTMWVSHERSIHRQPQFRKSKTDILTGSTIDAAWRQPHFRVRLSGKRAISRDIRPKGVAACKMDDIGPHHSLNTAHQRRLFSTSQQYAFPSNLTTKLNFRDVAVMRPGGLRFEIPSSDPEAAPVARGLEQNPSSTSATADIPGGHRARRLFARRYSRV